MEFSEKLKQMREMLGWSRERVARTARLSAQSIRRYEEAETVPSEAIQVLLIRALGKEIEVQEMRKISSSGRIRPEREADFLATGGEKELLRPGLEGLPAVLTWFKSLDAGDRVVVLGGLGKYAEQGEAKAATKKHGT